MSCHQCQGIEVEFDEKYASKSLKKYRKKGPAKTTKMMLDAIRTEGISGYSLLDIGGGVGAIQFELLKSRLSKAISVEASSAFLNIAKDETQQRGYEQHISFYHGNFVDLAKDIPDTDIVTLDRVICCYDEMEDLVTLSSQHASKVYAVVYPRDVRWVKFGFLVINFFLWLFRRSFRTFIHHTAEVDRLIRQTGLKQTYYEKAGIWQVVVYSRS
jgi:magnesium-protoporphyrin O-methyltransferase